jgi:hypothetical protein
LKKFQYNQSYYRFCVQNISYFVTNMDIYSMYNAWHHFSVNYSCFMHFFINKRQTMHVITSRTLFLLASTQGVSCKLVMNHLIYMYMFYLIPPPLIYMWVSVCTFMCIYLFSCPSVPAPQLLIFHREYLGWYIVVVYQS